MDHRDRPTRLRVYEDTPEFTYSKTQATKIRLALSLEDGDHFDKVREQLEDYAAFYMQARAVEQNRTKPAELANNLERLVKHIEQLRNGFGEEIIDALADQSDRRWGWARLIPLFAELDFLRETLSEAADFERQHKRRQVAIRLYIVELADVYAHLTGLPVGRNKPFREFVLFCLKPVDPNRRGIEDFLTYARDRLNDARNATPESTG